MKQTIRGYRFGPFHLDAAGYVLTRNGQRVRVAGSQMDLLLLFLLRPGQLISREQIVAALWKQPESVDVRQGLNTAVTRLRSVLGDDPANPKYLETVIGKGYRWIGSVEEDTDEGQIFTREATPEPAEELGIVEAEMVAEPDEVRLTDEDLPRGMAGGSRRTWWIWWTWRTWKVALAGVGCVLAAMLLGWMVFLVSKGREGRQAEGSNASGAQSRLAVRSLAVVPLVNLSDDKEQQYFADGLTDALISSLAVSVPFRVTSRASSMHFRGLDRSSREIARELDVDMLVEGSILRVGDRLHITVHLVDAAHDRDLWARSFDTPFRSSLSVIDSISRDIRQQLVAPAERGTPDATPASPVSDQAYDDYLRGRYLWRRRDLGSVVKAIDYFKRAAAKQPEFALAHAGLADAYLTSRVVDLFPFDEAIRLARGEAEQALRLDSRLPEAHTSMALVHELSYEWNEAEAEYRLALTLDPSYATARQWYSNHLSLRGRHAEAIEQARLGIAADPLSPSIQTQLGVAFYYARRYDEAIAAFKKTLELEPRYGGALSRMALSYAQKGLYSEALATLRTAPETERECMETLAYVEGHSGQRTEAAALIRRLEKGRPDPMGLLYATLPLGDKTKSFELIERVIAVRESGNFAVEPLFDPLRDDPRFQGIVARLKMP